MPNAAAAANMIAITTRKTAIVRPGFEVLAATSDCSSVALAVVAVASVLAG